MFPHHFDIRRPRGERGQALVEFAICSLTFLLLVLGALQLALVLNAQSAVRYAAYSAARSAIVWSGDRDKMVEAARIALLPIFPRHGRATTPRGYLENYLGARAVDQQRTWNDADNRPITDAQIINGDGRVVTFDDPVDASRAAITVRVVHQYELIVPFVNALVVKVRDLTSVEGETVDKLSAEAARDKRLRNRQRESGYRIPLVASYTMHLQSDYAGQ